MNKFIVTTTINNPTLAIRKFSKLSNWKLIIVGDKKTPQKKFENIKNIIYLSPKDQIKIDKELSNLIGWNCIQRRNFGYIYALSLGADYIATIDDDNIPYKFWGKIDINEKITARRYVNKSICFDPLSIFKFDEKYWHRGYPLQLIQNSEVIKKYLNVKNNFDIQANLWDLNPDIDAINRISLRNENVKFKNKFYYFSNTISPFNSQNTILNKDVMKNYFLFPFVGRMDDIWASFYVQSIGHKVVYGPSTVYQKRNLHNLYSDIMGEIIGYKNNLNLIKSLSQNPNNIKKFLPPRSHAAFKRYQYVIKKIKRKI